MWDHLGNFIRHNHLITVSYVTQDFTKGKRIRDRKVYRMEILDFVNVRNLDDSVSNTQSLLPAH